MTQRIGPGRIVGNTIEVRIGNEWRQMEPVKTPLGDVFLRLIERNPMLDQLIATYNDLMLSLGNLPDEIAAAQNDLTEMKQRLAKSEQTMKDISTSMSLTIEGKNAEERAAKLAMALKADQTYMGSFAGAETWRKEIANLTNDVDNLTRQFTAVGYQAKLHSAMVAYFAAAGAVAPTDVQFYSKGAHQHTTTGKANGNVTAEDAAAIGL